MKFIKKLFYYILHTFTNCPDADLDYFKKSKANCKKCGRIHLIWHV